jgi:glucokinase
MSESRFTAIGIDVGGTKIAAGLVSFPEGKLLNRHLIPTNPERGGEAVLEDVIRLAENLAKEANKTGTKVEGIGLGLCELVDPDGNIFSAHTIQWQGQPVKQRLSGIGPVIIEADVRAGGLAEALYGAGKAFRIFSYVTVGTGISCCLMLEGKSYLGAHGATGTMASSSATSVCESCGHSTHRTLEDIASGPALVARLGEIRPGIAKSGSDVLAAAASGDADALKVLSTAGHALGAAVGSLVNVLDPDAVVVGGGLGLRDGAYWESFTDSTRAHIWSKPQRTIPILHAATGDNAGLLGAAASAWKKITKDQIKPFSKG